MNSPDTAVDASDAPPRPAALIVWRLLSMLYDLFPVLALWMVAGAVFAIGYTLAGHDSHENIQPFSALQWLLWLVCWAITGVYSTFSWRRGGQTLGMRPWRLRVIGADAQAPGWKALWLRYSVATVSLLLAGLGFWWAWFDRERLTWHDRASGTRTIRLPKRPK
ncbi:RDD family protein [Lysobacter sp. CA199]|uniref:RDD family protein n=1 Tax=Lysobacter sp. CA199 TaxID=3455608 RepID=UPI003F8D3870